jgi:hypothetical protein
MKTPHLDEEIRILEQLKNLKLQNKKLTEYKAIKKQLESNPIVSTPDKPVWVVDEYGDKKILWLDLGEKVIYGRYILICKDYTNDFLNNMPFDYFVLNKITPYTEKVSIEVTQDEAVKVEEFLKGLRSGK